MMPGNRGKRMRADLCRFAGDRRGSMVFMAALAAVPLLGALGAAVDYSRHAQTRASLQQAADSAALAAAGLNGASDVLRKNYADAVFRASVKGFDTLNFQARGLTITGTTYEYKAVVTQKNVFLAAIGNDKTDVGVKAQVAMGLAAGGGGDYVIAVEAAALQELAGCWDELFKTLSDVLDVVKASPWSTKTFTSYFVFGDRVNVGLGRASWLSTGPGPAPIDWKGCLEPREELVSGNPYALTDALPTGLNRFKPSAKGSFLTPGIVQYYTSLGHADPKPGCPQPITGPTNDQTSVITAMKATPMPSLMTTGVGRQDEGMAWALRLISKTWSGQWGVPGYGAAKKQAVVFVTTGHTRIYDYEVGGAAGGSFGPNNGSKAGFDNFLAICNQIKAAGSEIFIVHTVPGNEYFKPYGQKCASSEKHYYNIGHFDPVEFRNGMRQLFTTPVFQAATPRLIQ